ncbi:HTH-type transcriptional repressor RspR [Anaerolineales bacterium]|nr:HTH-type transcriptional repressor RspR [Anaerolineales bacterium]
MIKKTHAPKPRASDQVENELRRLILTLELEPGLAVSESSLMKRFGWGRTPLREAFQRLAEQSLLQIIPQHGAVVTPLAVFDFVEMMDAMGMVIGSAASLACRRLTEEQLSRLDEIVSQAESAASKNDFASLADLDYEFHQILAEATGNRYLQNYLLHLHQAATRFNYAAWLRDGHVGESLGEHRRIVDIFRRRDPAQAKTVMLEHIEGARQRVLGTMKNGE